MNNGKPRLFLLFSILICLTICGTAYANPNDRFPPFEEMFTKIGYKSVEEAVKEFENHFKSNVKLPALAPSIPFTHQFGRFSEDVKYDINDSLEIIFVNEKLRRNNYTIDIRPLRNKLVFKNRINQQVYTLQNGQKAIYLVDSQLFNFLVFEKDNWQYMLGIDSKASSKVTPDVLVDIANSFLMKK